MNGITEKLNFSILIAKTTTRLLSLNLAKFSSSSLRFFKAVLPKALRAVFFFSMDDLFSSYSENDDNLFDLDCNPYARKRPLSFRLGCDDYELTDEEETNRHKLYLVPYSWLKEAQRSVADEVGGILYTVSSYGGYGDSEIVLDLSKEPSSVTRDKAEGGDSETIGGG